MLGGNPADESRELARVVEAGEVAELGDDGEGHDPLHAAQGLQGLDDGPQSPLWCELEEFLLDAPEPFDLFVDGPDGFLEHDLLRGGGTDDLGQVTLVGLVPIVRRGDAQLGDEELRSARPNPLTPRLDLL